MKKHLRQTSRKKHRSSRMRKQLRIRVLASTDLQNAAGGGEGGRGVPIFPTDD